MSIVTEISLRGAYKANNDLENDFRELLLASIARGSKSQTTGSRDRPRAQASTFVKSRAVPADPDSV